MVEPQPLFIVPKTNTFWYPNESSGLIEIPSGQQVELFCADSFENTETFQRKRQLLPTCVEGKTYQLKGEKYQLDEFTCKSHSRYYVKRTNTTCAEDSLLAIVGFNITNGRFLETMEVCHNEKLQMTHYSKHKLYPTSYNFQKSTARIGFSKTGFYKGKDVNHLYTINQQKKIFGKLLNDSYDNYFSKKQFLSRGHLSAKSDHIFGSHQRTTFTFINAAPQWQRFNDGTWNTIENEVKRYVSREKITVDCYTGAWGVSSLPDVNGTFKELFLSVNGTTKQIPVPKLFYKILIHPINQKGVALVGVNNPHINEDQLKQDYIICDDISEEISWMKMKKNNIAKGFYYACEVSDFLDNTDMPKMNFTVNGLLV